MNVAEKEITIAQNVPKVFTAGYEKGKAEGGTAKPEQEKAIEITKNGTTEVLPDNGKTLSKVSVEVDVPSDDSKLCEMISRDIEEIVIPKNITKIGRSAFAYSKLKKVTIPENVTTIDISAFENCTALSEILFPDSIKTIGYASFRFCGALTNIIIPFGVTTIELNAFQKCDVLETVYIPKSVTNLAKTIFAQCTLLANLTIECEIKGEISLETNLNLTTESAKSVLIHLVNHVGTNKEYIYKVLFHSNTWDLLDAEGETAPGGITWRIYVANKGWNT